MLAPSLVTVRLRTGNFFKNKRINNVKGMSGVPGLFLVLKRCSLGEVIGVDSFFYWSRCLSLEAKPSVQSRLLDTQEPRVQVARQPRRGNGVARGRAAPLQFCEAVLLKNAFSRSSYCKSVSCSQTGDQKSERKEVDLTEKTCPQRPQLDACPPMKRHLGCFGVTCRLQPLPERHSTGV